MTDLDLLVLPGGADVNPLRYNEPPGFYTDKPDIVKEYFDVFVLPKYIEQRTPIFGICRGAQTIAISFGCSLLQHMYHETNTSDDPYKGVHSLLVADKSKKIKVNSRHHQSIRRPKDDSLVKVIATHSNNGGHIEAIRIQGYPIAAVQFHPEDLNEESGVEYACHLINGILKK
jgi:putative glutamine amidotransferase